MLWIFICQEGMKNEFQYGSHDLFNIAYNLILIIAVLYSVNYFIYQSRSLSLHPLPLPPSPKGFLTIHLSWKASVDIHM
jgi:hypothetical protein